MAASADSADDLNDALIRERHDLRGLLRTLDPDEWDLPTECPAYSVQGVATHILGDDLSLLSRQRDGAPAGLITLAVDMPGTDFRTLLDTFNDGWVAAARFCSPQLLIDLLDASGRWSNDFYGTVDPAAPSEPIPMFGAFDRPAPYWQAIAREYLERWVHHSQIRRAIGRSSLDDPLYVRTGASILAAMADTTADEPESPDGAWHIGNVSLGERQQAAAVLTRAYTPTELDTMLSGPPEECQLLGAAAGRPADP
ncbi:MAG: maleylpyruvate isomerase N-terminal domain-containing protein [Actinomycetota bacterium]